MDPEVQEGQDFMLAHFFGELAPPDLALEWVALARAYSVVDLARAEERKHSEESLEDLAAAVDALMLKGLHEIPLPEFGDLLLETSAKITDLSGREKTKPLRVATKEEEKEHIAANVDMALIIAQRSTCGGCGEFIPTREALMAIAALWYFHDAIEFKDYRQKYLGEFRRLMTQLKTLQTEASAEVRDIIGGPSLWSSFDEFTMMPAHEWDQIPKTYEGHEKGHGR